MYTVSAALNELKRRLAALLRDFSNDKILTATLQRFVVSYKKMQLCLFRAIEEFTFLTINISTVFCMTIPKETSKKINTNKNYIQQSHNQIIMAMLDILLCLVYTYSMLYKVVQVDVNVESKQVYMLVLIVSFTGEVPWTTC